MSLAFMPYGPTARPSLSRRSFVVSKEPAKSVVTANTPTVLFSGSPSMSTVIAQPLMISLEVIMGHEFGQGAAEVTLPDRDDPIQALFFDRSHKSGGAGESHPQALTEPYVTVSRHTARTISPLR